MSNQLIYKPLKPTSQNGEISMIFNFYVYVRKVFFGLISYFIENTVCLIYNDH